MSDKLAIELELNFLVKLDMVDLVQMEVGTEKEIAELIQSGDQEDIDELIDRLPNNFENMVHHQFDVERLDVDTNRAVAQITIDDKVLISNLDSE